VASWLNVHAMERHRKVLRWQCQYYKHYPVQIVPGVASLGHQAAALLIHVFGNSDAVLVALYSTSADRLASTLLYWRSSEL
jgi:hypothetical protein